MGADFDDLHEEFDSRLEDLGLKLELYRDADADSYLDACDVSVCAIHRDSSQNDFFWDFANPFASNDGFSQKSLFLYLNSMSDIEKWMSQGFRDPGGKSCYKPDCEEADNVLFLAEKTLRDFREGRMSDISANIDQILGIAKMKPNDPAEEANIWLTDMLGPSEGSRGYAADYLKGSAFAREGGMAAGSHALSMLAMFGQDREMLETILENLVHDLKDYTDEHRRTFAGELLFAKAVKRDFAEKFGGEEPAACSGLEQGDYECCLALPENADTLIILHEKDAAQFANPMEHVENIAECERASRNGAVFGFAILDDKDNHVDSMSGFYGDDMERNGMRSAIAEAVLGLENRPAEGM